MGIKKNFAFNLLLNFSNIIFPILTIPYVSRILGVESVGKFNFIITITSYFILLSALGIPLYGVREIAKVKENIAKKNTLFNEIVSINFFSSLICSLLFVGLVFLIPELNVYKHFYFIAGFGILFSFLNIDWFFSGLENFKIIAIRSLVVKAINIVALFLFVKEPSDLPIYILIYTTSTLFNQIWNFISLKRFNIKINITRKGLVKHLPSLTTLMFSAIAMQIYLMIDTVIIGFLLDYGEVGIYSSAIKSVRMVMPIITSLGVVLLPRIALYGIEEREKRDRLLNQSFILVNFLSVPITIFFILIAPYFVPIFFGPGYEGVVKPMQFLSALIFISNISYFFSIQVLAMLSKEKLFLTTVLVGMIINVSLNFIFIPKLGVIGAAIASIIGEVCISMLSIYYVFKILKVRISFRPVINGLISSLPILLFYYIFIIMNIYFTNLIQIIFIGFVYLTSYILFQYFVFKNEMISLIVRKIKK